MDSKLQFKANYKAHLSIVDAANLHRRKGTFKFQRRSTLCLLWPACGVTIGNLAAKELPCHGWYAGGNTVTGHLTALAHFIADSKALK